MEVCAVEFFIVTVLALIRLHLLRVRQAGLLHMSVGAMLLRCQLLSHHFQPSWHAHATFFHVAGTSSKHVCMPPRTRNIDAETSTIFFQTDRGP